jgi:Ca2+-transporting ATPase
MPAVAPVFETVIDPLEPQGLSQTDAAARLVADGPNSLPSTGQRGFWVMVLNIIREPMLMLLITCGIVYLILGDPQEAALLLSAVVFIFGITIV